jgi:hypothetical protein
MLLRLKFISCSESKLILFDNLFNWRFQFRWNCSMKFTTQPIKFISFYHRKIYKKLQVNKINFSFISAAFFLCLVKRRCEFRLSGFFIWDCNLKNDSQVWKIKGFEFFWKEPSE